MKKALPTGIGDYASLKIENYYAVDKSMMIYEFLSLKTKVTLITRPRRFGKTLNMSMMAEFFDITKDSKDIFKDTNIMNTEYASYINQYPTIFISFANAKGEKKKVIRAIKVLIYELYEKYENVFRQLDDYNQILYQNIINHVIQFDNGQLDGIEDSLVFLMKVLEKYYGKKVMVFIDEYDTPFIEAHVNGFYNEIKSSLSLLLHNALKSSTSLQYGMLTGIQRVAKENIFSDLNNLSVCTVRDKQYDEYFGFNEQETRQLLEYYGLKLDDQVKAMYDGYHIGNQNIYNPWSIVKYAQSQELIPYWVNVSSNVMIRNAMKKRKRDFDHGYEKLISHEKLETYVTLETSFYEDHSTSSLWGLFINAGYLTIEKTISKENDIYSLRIPNNEVKKDFRSLTAYYLNMSETYLTQMTMALEISDRESFIVNYQNILMELPSYHDLKDENSYHMMMLGMSAYLNNDYEIKSNRESGNGRSDIILKSKRKELSSYILEFKYTKDEHTNLKHLANQAIEQIINNCYDAEIDGEIIYIGLAHRKKECEIIWQNKSLLK